jgi:hypothetical protein
MVVCFAVQPEISLTFFILFFLTFGFKLNLMKQIYPFLFVLIASFILSCGSGSTNEENETATETQNSENNTYNSFDSDNSTSENDVDTELDIEDSEEEDLFGCKYPDGTYSADVDYYNPETGHSASYSLTVEVQDCQVVQINFPNGGWVDSDHISPADLDDSGSATIDGEDGKTFNVQINN